MLSVLFLALALSVDAFAVAFSYGLVIRENCLKNAIKLSLATGFGQFIMPILGWFATNSVHEYIHDYDHWVAFFVFIALGLNIIIGVVKGGDDEKNIVSKLSFKLLLTIGIATSIDAAVSGISLYFIPVNIYLSAGIIGLVCFVISMLGFYLNIIFKKVPTNYMQIAAGVILIILGFKTLGEHIL